ncbi:g10125 [Coccomyxa elongata]
MLGRRLKVQRNLVRVISIQISKQILTGSGGGCTGTTYPLTAQFIQTHLADTPEPHSPDILCTDENLAGFTHTAWTGALCPALGA